MASYDELEAAVLRANERFYEAFEQLDIQAMSTVWLHADRARCIHPGWRTLRGWPAIKESWIAIFSNTEDIKFTITDVSVSLCDRMAWVSCVENIIDSGNTIPVVSTIEATNIFERIGTEWRMVQHHASMAVRERESLDWDPSQN
ncbi:MAG TPA: nuclear transport factor 2 family protein [Alphaproteobacteria bacterium]|nr:nuclear transport factor 2 family protein [Alphaproteobacteria bacterium]